MDWLKEALKNVPEADRVSLEKEIHDTITNSYIPQHRYAGVKAKSDTASEKILELEAELKNLNIKAEVKPDPETKTDSNSKDLIMKLTAEFENYRREIDTEKTNTKKLLLLEKNLKDAGATSDALDLLTSTFNLEDFKLVNGALEGLEDTISKLKTDKKSLFAEVKAEGTGEPHEGDAVIPGKAELAAAEEKYKARPTMENMALVSALRTRQNTE